MKAVRSALMIAAAATGAFAQVGNGIGSGPVNPSEQFGILTIHSGAVAVHLQTWTLETEEVFLSVGSVLTMTLDANGVLRDQNNDVGCISQADGSIQFLSTPAITSNFITGPWVSNNSEGAAIIPPNGLGAYGCENTTASAYQMFAFSASPTALPSCTGVLLQPVNSNGIITSLSTPSATSSASSTSSGSSASVTSAASSVGSSLSAASSGVPSASGNSASTGATTATTVGSTTAPTTTGAPPSPTILNSGASAERVMIAGAVAVIGFAGLLVA